MFGDAQGILDRLHAFALLRLEAGSRNRLLIRALCQELHSGPYRRIAADVFADPVVLVVDVGVGDNGDRQFPPTSRTRSCHGDFAVFSAV